MSTIKIRIDIVPDRTTMGPHGGQRYALNRWVFERKTGRTLSYDMIGSGMTLKEARKRKRETMEAYCG
jgi:hypothetical protein